METHHRQVCVPPDRFEVTADDTVFTVDLRCALAVCIYDTVDQAGALLHLRVITHGATPTDSTDTTLATELLLLDRCVERLREIAPGARALQARIAAHLAEGEAARHAYEGLLALVRDFLADVNIVQVSADAAAGAPRILRFHPSMGTLRIR